MNAMTFAARALALSALAASTVPVAAAAAAAGDPDPSFGDGGRRLMSSVGMPVEVLVQPDGKTIVVTDNQLFALNGFAVTRLNVDGSLDRSFDGDGTAGADFGADDVATGAALQPDGKIVVAGHAGSGMAVARFDTNGSLDPTFDPGGADGDGKKLIATQSGAVDVVLQEDGMIALANARAGAGEDFSVVRLSENGVPEQNPFQPADFGGGDDSPVAATGVPDAAIIVVGRTSDAGRPVTAVARYTLDGKLDQTLAGSGKLTIADIAEPKSVHATPEGKIVVTGRSGGDDPHTVVARLNRDGAPDESFGRGGVAAVDFDGPDSAVAAALAPDGKVVVASTASLDPAFDAARLTAAGTLDGSFANGGLTRFPVADVFAIVSAAALAPDGRLVIAGAAVMSGPVPRAVVVRLAADAPPQPAGPPDVGQQAPRPLADTQAPRLRALRVTAPYVRFTLPEAARVRFTLRQARPGGRFRAAGPSFTARGVAGANRVRLARRLKRGRYRLTATATDAAGNVGRTQRLTFTVKRGRS
jgi:uncharacterized delta-60 repeat protein